MLRSGQMMLAKAFTTHYLGPGLLSIVYVILSQKLLKVYRFIINFLYNSCGISLYAFFFTLLIPKAKKLKIHCMLCKPLFQPNFFKFYRLECV